jgi:hypothetical protein
LSFHKVVLLVVGGVIGKSIAWFYLAPEDCTPSIK